MIMSILDSFENAKYVLGLSWVFFFIQFGLDYYVYRVSDRENSPMVGLLIKRGYGWSFGFTVGLTFFVAELLSFFLIRAFLGHETAVDIGFLLLSLLSFFIAVAFLNIWAKRFLILRGIHISKNYGLKWLVREYKEALRKAKDDMAKPQDP